MAKPILSLEHVGVNYNSSLLRRARHDFWALEDVSLTLYAGDSLGVVGRNGMGKSTLLRVMAGILQPDRGTITREAKIRAALLSLQVGFVQHLSGRENIFLSGLLLGLRYAEIEAMLPHIVAFAELEGAIHKPVGTYSDGMRARLGFSISFQMNPDILLVDEVLGVGDASFREKSSAMMKRRLQSDRTVVLVSHNPATIRDVCTRAVWIEGGRTMAEGETKEVMREYELHLHHQQATR